MGYASQTREGVEVVAGEQLAEARELNVAFEALREKLDWDEV